MGKMILAMILSLGYLSLSYAEAQIEIKDIWVRETPPGTSITALYMNIENSGGEDDTLKSVSSNISKSAEIHNTSVDQHGVAKMEMLESVSVPARESVHFEPGGMHIMLIDLREPLKSGDKVDIELVFDRAGQMKVQAEVVGIGDKSQEQHHH
jgi:periplasmic copper chaperone A